jgi:hypothetical protein
MTNGREIDRRKLAPVVRSLDLRRAAPATALSPTSAEVSPRPRVRYYFIGPVISFTGRPRALVLGFRTSTYEREAARRD